MAYWLMKSEPDAYSIDDLERDGREPWDGIRNYQARNMMRDDMQIGDEVFFYHSNCKEPGIVGIMRVASEPYPDPTQFDPESHYFDPKATASYRPTKSGLTSSKTWEWVLGVNLWGVIHGVRSFVPRMLSQEARGSRPKIWNHPR